MWIDVKIDITRKHTHCLLTIYFYYLSTQKNTLLQKMENALTLIDNESKAIGKEFRSGKLLPSCSVQFSPQTKKKS